MAKAALPELDIAQFLEASGLGQLIEPFRRQDIDGTVLLSLTEADLRELGLTLGQRKKLLLALQSWRGLHETAASPLPRGEKGFEARRISVLFCDMVGSTDLSQRLTPDELSDLMQAYYRTAAQVTRTRGGYIATLQGDGIVVVFGYPQAMGNHAERAVLSGLALAETFASGEHLLPDGRAVAIRVRIGVASGQSVVGLGEQQISGNEVYLFGPVPNLAARLQTHAEPGCVVTDAETQVQAASAFRWKRLPDAVLKGIDGPVSLFQVLGPVDGEGRIQSGHRELPLFGRTAERDRLAEDWASALSGQPRFAVISGEAGVGKSRLLAQVEEAVRSSGARHIRLACGPLYSNVPLHPVIEALSEAIGRRGESSDAARIEQLRATLPDAAEAAIARVAQLLGLPGATPLEGEPAAAARAALLATLGDWLLGLADRPALLTLEDAHWADATTLELLSGLSGRSEPRMLMAVATTRDPAPTLFSNRDDRRVLPLGGLPQAEAARLLDAALDGLRLPEELRRGILAHGEGNPLMIEELAKAAGNQAEAALQGEVRVPLSIYDSIAARLDRLPLARGLAGMLAVCGIEAPLALLADAMGTSPALLDPFLGELRDASILDPKAAGETGIVRFRHMIYRDVVYERLVGNQRVDLHARAAEAMARLDPDLAERQPELLAWHLIRARKPAAAAPMALRAGERAVQRSALIEGGHYLEQALAALEALGEDPEALRMQMRALSGLAAVKRARFGIASDEVGALSARVLQIARSQGDTRSELLALNGLYAHAVVRADYPAAGRWAQALTETARAVGDPTFEMIGIRGSGAVALHVGQFPQAVVLLRDALDRYDQARHLPLAHAHGYDHAEICAVFLSFALWCSGDLQEARRISDYSVSHSRTISHAHSLAQALAFRALLGLLARDLDLAAAGTEAADLGERYGLKVMGAAGAFFRSAALTALDPAPEESLVAALLHEQEVFRAANPYNYGVLTETAIVDAMMHRGDLTGAARHLDLADAEEVRSGETWTQSERLRLAGLLAAREGRSAAAVAQLVRAHDCAVEMGAATLALRIACDLAELAPGPAAQARLQTAADAMTSLDDGFDCTRMRRLMQWDRAEADPAA